MYYTDLKTQNKTLISSGHFLDYAYPQVYGDKVFWEDYRTGHSQLYVYSLENNREYQIAPQYFSQYDCSVDGDIAAWTTYGGDLYYTNISGLIEKKISVNSSEPVSGPPESGLDMAISLFAISTAFLILVAKRGRL
jgi:beta propeller repeat protein